MMPIYAQNPLSQKVQAEVGVGFVMPFLQSGTELMRSKELRENGLSYFADAGGSRKNVGKYPNNTGFSISIGFYKPVKWAKGLMLGAIVRNAQTGAQPGNGGYAEGYYFNFLTAGITLKYYPFEKNNFFAKGDFGMAAVFTKNRYLNSAGEQNFFHQFGIGSGGSIGLGYTINPFKNKKTAFDLQAIYQQLSTRVEVNGIGNDQWRFGALHISVCLIL